MNLKELAAYRTLEEKVAALEARIEALEAKKSPGRPPNPERKVA
jgi:BMFP domain-containing protein YqiC